jgi:copper(I)-binding protein
MNKIRIITLTLFITVFNLNLCVLAQPFAEEISVETPYIRATIPGTSITSAYMGLKNNSNNEAVLIGASSSVSDRIEIHQHIMSDGMMKMRHVEKLVLNAKEQVTLQPMGYHLMIFNVKRTLTPQDNVLITLHFKQQKDVVVTLPVQSIKQEQQVKKQHHHH